MGWFSDLFEDKKPSTQGFFESNKDYRNRVYIEGKERIIKELSGSQPSQGFFEGDDNYRRRVAQESNERIIEAETGSQPNQGFFEREDSYRTRVHNESNERIIEGATGSKPSQGFFESEETYQSRISHEANESIVESATGSKPSQGFFENEDSYQTRVSQEAKESKASDGGCFITTACVEYAGFSDNCHELEVIRQFRDGYIAKLPDGGALISEYYQTAPQIVKAISLSPLKDEIWRYALQSIIDMAVKIESGENKIALDIYIKLVTDLKSKV